MRIKCPSFSLSVNGCCFDAVSHCISSFQFLTIDLYRFSGGIKCVDFFLQVQFNSCDVCAYQYLYLAKKMEMLTPTLNHQAIHIHAHVLICGVCLCPNICTCASLHVTTVSYCKFIARCVLSFLYGCRRPLRTLTRIRMDL